MTTKVGVVRDNRELDTAFGELQELEARSARIGLGESSGWANQTLVYARQVQDMIRLAQVVTRSARQRDECRGAHFKPEFELQIPAGKFPGDPEFEAYREEWKRRNDRWLKTTLATHRPEGPMINFESVDISVLPPEEPRDYR
jgi:succinate dehydrogenase / fumarate reductase flavoprotein subunit